MFVEGADAGALASPMARLLDLDLDRILLWLFARAVEASPYWAGMAGLARTLYSLLTLAACSEELAADRTDAYGIDEAQLLVAAARGASPVIRKILEWNSPICRGANDRITGSTHSACVHIRQGECG